MDLEAVSAVDNPELATLISSQVLAEANASMDDDGVPENPPVPPLPPDLVVTLPGGLVNLARAEVTTEAEVRELDGEDEEYIARVGNNFAKTLDAILQRGVVRIGDDPVSKKTLDSLLAGDRDALLVAIRRVTFGDEIEFAKVVCPECDTEQEMTVSLADDVPTRSLDDPFDFQFSLTLKSGKAVDVVLPDGSVQRALASATERNEAVLNTLLLSKCVKAINGLPVVGDAQVRKGLTIRERREIMDEINERTPGPRLGEVKRPCSECENEISLPLSLAAIFLG